MTDHYIMMTLPRSGPPEDHPGLRALGFVPIPSEHRDGWFTCWVKHIWDLGPYRCLAEITEIEASLPDLRFTVIDELGKIEAERIAPSQA